MDFQYIFDSVIAAAKAMTWLEIGSVFFLVAYVLLAVRQSVWRWPAGIIGTSLYLTFCVKVDLYAETVLQMFYLVMSVYGWYMWARGKEDKSPLTVTTAPWQFHAIIIAFGAVATAGVGWYLENHTNATLSYVDTFSTVFGIITTWMVAKKLLENWLYWIVIDIVFGMACWEREWYLFSLLYFFYAIIAVQGFFAWRKSRLSAV